MDPVLRHLDAPAATARPLSAASVAAQTGISAADAQRHLTDIAVLTGGRVEIVERRAAGRIVHEPLFAFPANVAALYRSRKARAGWSEWVAAVVWPRVVIAFRLSFGVALAFSLAVLTVAVVVLLVALAYAQSQGGGGGGGLGTGRGSGGSGGGGGGGGRFRSSRPLLPTHHQPSFGHGRPGFSIWRLLLINQLMGGSRPRRGFAPPRPAPAPAPAPRQPRHDPNPRPPSPAPPVPPQPDPAEVQGPLDPDGRIDMPFLDAVSSFLFGDGDPNAAICETQWQYVGHIVSAHGGVVPLEPVVPFDLAARPAPADPMVVHPFVLEAIRHFGDGFLEASDAGDALVVVCPLLAQCEPVPSPQPVSKFLRELPEEFSAASSASLSKVFAYGIVNLILVLALPGLYDQAAVALAGSPWLTLVANVMWIQPILLNYALLFFLWPLLRAAYLHFIKNPRIERRNAARAELVRDASPRSLALAERTRQQFGA